VNHDNSEQRKYEMIFLYVFLFCQLVWFVAVEKSLAQWH